MRWEEQEEAAYVETIAALQPTDRLGNDVKCDP